MRKLISAMKISVDGKIAGPDGNDADWVESWSEDYGLTPHVAVCSNCGKFSSFRMGW